MTALGAAACGEVNETCPVGRHFCTDTSGDTRDLANGPHLRVCAGPDNGGDDDGEFLLIEDCAATGKVCITDFADSTELGSVGRCVAPECVSDECLELGTTRCDGTEIQTCSMIGPCQNYTTDIDCSPTSVCRLDENEQPTCAP